VNGRKICDELKIKTLVNTHIFRCGFLSFLRSKKDRNPQRKVTKKKE
jgi:hypothetical protein